MGMFDSMGGNVRCPSCGSVVGCYMQFKWLDCVMSHYEVGDYLQGSAPYHILDEDEMPCSSCEAVFKFFAVGKRGYLFGFANEKELDALNENFSLFYGEGKDFFISVSETRMKNIDEFLAELKNALLSNPEKREFFFDDVNETDLSSFVCRIPSGMKEVKALHAAGDKVYYDNSGGSHHVWPLKDKIFTVSEVNFDERSQRFRYHISNSYIAYYDLAETLVLDEKQRDAKILFLDNEEKKILSWYEDDQESHRSGDALDEKKKNLKKAGRLAGAIQASLLIDRMKSEGKIPMDYHPWKS